MKNINKYYNIANRLNFNLRTESSSGQDYNGFYRHYGKLITLVDLDESQTVTAYYNREKLTFKYTVIHTFIHELTHFLQHKDNKYQDMALLGYMGKKTIHRNGIYAYNEIVANTVAMLLYPNNDSINDNIHYVNMYIKNVEGTSRNTNKAAFNDRLKNDLKNDIDKYYNIIKEQLEIEGLL